MRYGDDAMISTVMLICHWVIAGFYMEGAADVDTERDSRN